jgi:hypothetical protein
VVTCRAPPSMAVLGESLNEVKWRYEGTFDHTVDAVEQDDIKSVVTRGAPLPMAVLEQSWK